LEQARREREEAGLIGKKDVTQSVKDANRIERELEALTQNEDA
jgi:predicted RNA-binding protein associated with RNAse of E/G family